jgi:CheY-like chemotaxis protein
MGEADRALRRSPAPEPDVSAITSNKLRKGHSPLRFAFSSDALVWQTEDLKGKPYGSRYRMCDRRIALLTDDPIHVFVVDDQPFVASALADILRLSGFSAVPFRNLREALQAARFDSPDLLISEIERPRLSGIDLAFQLKAMYLDSNILLVSRHADCLDLLDRPRRIGRDFHASQEPIGRRRLVAEFRDLDWDNPLLGSDASNFEIKPTAVPA